MKKRRSIGQILIDFRTILILIFLIAIFTYLKPVFINPINLLNMLKRQSFTMIAAFGMTFLLTLGVFDMSAGSTVALVGIVLAYGLNKGVSAAVMLPAVVILSIVCGLINGIIVVKGKIPAFLTTLATMNMSTRTGTSTSITPPKAWRVTPPSAATSGLSTFPTSSPPKCPRQPRNTPSAFPCTIPWTKSAP